MRSAQYIFCFLLFGGFLQAQDTPFFTEEFSSNDHQWPTIDKKFYMGISSDQYHIYNSEGKQRVSSLIDLPFDDQKNYRIETLFKQSYTPERGADAYGFFFGASDEENGYVFAFDGTNRYFLLNAVNDKLFVKKEGVCMRKDRSGFFYRGDDVTILLEAHRWKFFVNDSLVYSCLPLPMLGHKTGFSVTGGTGMIIEHLNVFEAEPDPEPCPILFSQEEFNATLDRIICAAPEDFSSLLGEFDFEYSGYESWTTRHVSLAGASKLYIGVDGVAQQYREGKDFVIKFVCSDSTTLEINQAYFGSLRNAMSRLEPTCCTLEIGDSQEHLSDALIASSISHGKIKHPSAGTVTVEVELDLVYVSNYYSVLLHVNIPKT